MPLECAVSSSNSQGIFHGPSLALFPSVSPAKVFLLTRPLCKVFQCPGSHLTLILVNCPLLPFSNHYFRVTGSVIPNGFCRSLAVKAYLSRRSWMSLFSTHFPSVVAESPKSSTFLLLFILPGAIILGSFSLLVVPPDHSVAS